MNFELIDKVANWCSRFYEKVTVVPVFGWVVAFMCFMCFCGWMLIYSVFALVRGVYNLIFK